MPLPITFQITLQPLASINQPHVACRRTKVTSATTTASWDLQVLARIDHVWVADIVVACQIFKRAVVEATRNGPECVSLLHSV